VIEETGEPWAHLLTEADRELIDRARFARRMGMGKRPALLIIDVQNYMVGPPLGSTHDYPSACGASAEQAVCALAALLTVARKAHVPVIYTKYVLRRDGSDIGVYGLKRDLLASEGWCLEGSEGSEISELVSPIAIDTVLVKKKPSAFFGTPLLSYLIDRRVDTVVITGGSTSNCVRATAVDSMSYNFRTAVVEDCVFDRFQLSHLAALFDLDRQYADVVRSAQMRQYFQGLDSAEVSIHG
jgi:maleamate amidohydrolase